MRRVLATFFTKYQFQHPGPREFFDTVTEVTGRNLGWFFDEVYRSSDVFDYGVETLNTTRESGSHRTNVIVRRFGEAVFPVDVKVTFEGGKDVVEQWTGRERWKLYTYLRAEAAVSAQVDPRRVLLLDVNYTNNSRTLQPRGQDAAAKWSMKWMVWLQDALMTWGMLI
jgi:hypothetical protein